MTVKVEKQNGELSPQSKADLRAAFDGLPDGEHYVSLYPADAAMPHIEGIIEWYNGVSEQERGNPTFLDKLILKAGSLSYYLFRFAHEVGELYSDKTAAELRRKAAFFAAMKRHKEEAAKGSEKFVFSTAEIMAENSIKGLREAEALADSLFFAAKIVRDAAGNVLQRMSQEISNLKSEKNIEMRSDNRNFPQP